MHFSAGSCVKFGWETFKKRPWFFIGVAAVTFVVGWLIGFVSGFIQGFAGAAGSSAAGGVIGFIVSFCLQSLLTMGIIALYLKAHDAPESAELTDLWHPQLFVAFLVTNIIVGVFVFLGMLLLIVPGIIVALMLMFANYLVIARSLQPTAAMKESARITSGHKWELLILGVLLFLVNLLGVLCLIVGLLVTIPITYLAIVHAFRTLEQSAGEAAPAPVAAA